MSARKHIPPGTRFARWVIIGPAELLNTRRSASLCLCDCGNKKIVRNYSLLGRGTTSCGCSNIGNFRHGYRISPTYQTWASMIQRCNNPNSVFFFRYGGRGIKVCDRWMDFQNFLADMGERPNGLSLERINNSLGYYKENCKWATQKEQSRNMRTNRLVTYNGKTLTLIEWSEKTKICRQTLARRLDAGWSPERALTEPLHPR